MAAKPAFTWMARPPAKSSELRPMSGRVGVRREGAQPAVVGEDPVGDRDIDQQRPEGGEDEERAELGALGEGAGDERRA